MQHGRGLGGRRRHRRRIRLGRRRLVQHLDGDVHRGIHGRVRLALRVLTVRHADRDRVRRRGLVIQHGALGHANLAAGGVDDEGARAGQRVGQRVTVGIGCRDRGADAGAAWRVLRHLTDHSQVAGWIIEARPTVAIVGRTVPSDNVDNDANDGVSNVIVSLPRRHVAGLHRQVVAMGHLVVQIRVFSHRDLASLAINRELVVPTARSTHRVFHDGVGERVAMRVGRRHRRTHRGACRRILGHFPAGGQQCGPGDADAALRPGALPLIVSGQHLYLVDRARLQTADDGPGHRAVEGVRYPVIGSLGAVANVVVGRRRHSVQGDVRPRHVQ